MINQAKSVFAFAAALAVGSVAFAAAAVVDQRQSDMKVLNRAMKGPAAMVKGQASFDLAAVKSTLDMVAKKSLTFKTMFPPDTQKGTESKASIWANKVDFDGGFDTLTAAATAAAGTIEDAQTLKAECPKVVSECSGCHRIYKSD